MTCALSRTLCRREVLRWLAMTPAAAVAAACAPQVVKETVEKPVKETIVVRETVIAEPTPSYEQGELKMLGCCFSPQSYEIALAFNARFEAAHPGTKLTLDLLPAGQNYFEKLQTLFAAGTAPDVFDMWEGYVQPYAANGALLKMDPFLEMDPKIKKEDILPAVWEGGSWQNSLYALIFGFIPGPVSLYFNVDHFDQAGLDYPSSDWLWDDVRDAARVLTTQASGGATPERWGLAFDLWFVPWLYWIWSNGGDVFNEDETHCTLTDAKCVEALQYWADMVNVDKSAATGSTLQSLQGALNAFMTGAVSMYLGNAWDVSTLTPNKELKWKAVLSPKANNGNRVWYMHSHCWSIAATTKMPRLAWEYVRDFTLEVEPSKEWQEANPEIPGLRQLLYAFATPTSSALGYDPLIALVSQPGVLRVPGAGDKWDKISGIIQAELDLAFIGDKSVAEAAAAAAPKVDEELSAS
ncbi:MAG: sugar ABC transporter substrate-binding protein [Anaerolineae bacterium]|nr:sugar ABC transporter substrate-binding protein [Anaerolineae bacterium]